MKMDLLNLLNHHWNCLTYCWNRYGLNLHRIECVCVFQNLLIFSLLTWDFWHFVSYLLQPLFESKLFLHHSTRTLYVNYVQNLLIIIKNIYYVLKKKGSIKNAYYSMRWLQNHDFSPFVYLLNLTKFDPHWKLSK